MGDCSNRADQVEIGMVGERLAFDHRAERFAAEQMNVVAGRDNHRPTVIQRQRRGGAEPVPLRVVDEHVAKAIAVGIVSEGFAIDGLDRAHPDR